MKKIIATLIFAAAMAVAAYAQTMICELEPEPEDNTFGGWFFMEANHSWDNGLSLTGYVEHDNYQFERLECNYGRLALGYKALPWLKFGVNYVPVQNPGNNWAHYGETDVMATLKEGNMSVSIRERYRYGFTTQTNELRSRLKVAYKVPDTKLGFYVAPEVFTWGNTWKKTRHYAAATYDITPKVQIETYYVYYAFNNLPAENVWGLGINLDL